MRAFAETLPEFWAIFEKSLDGTQVGSYYTWKDPDGTLREKYMECVPVAGTPYRIAATTYMDEFDAPIRETREKAQAVFESMSRQMIWMTALVTCAALLVAFALSAYISGPVAALVEASQRVEAGEFAPWICAAWKRGRTSWAVWRGSFPRCCGRWSAASGI